MSHPPSIHIGQLIRQELRRQGRSVTWFAGQLCYTRTHIYKIFERDSIDTQLLRRVSHILNRNFFNDLSAECAERL